MRVELQVEGGVLMVPQRDAASGSASWCSGTRSTFSRRLGRRQARRDRRSSARPVRTIPVRICTSCTAATRRVTWRTAGRSVTHPRHQSTAGQGMTMAIEDAAPLARHAGRCSPPAAISIARSSPTRPSDVPRNSAQLRWSHWSPRLCQSRRARRRAAASLVPLRADSPIGQRIQRTAVDRLAA